MLSSLALIAGVTCVVLIFRPSSGPEQAAPNGRESPTRGQPSSTAVPPAKTYSKVPDQAEDAPAIEDLVEDFIRVAGLTPGDAGKVRGRPAGDDTEFDIEWGEVKLTRTSETDAGIRFWRAGWDQPKGTGATLPGDLALVESVGTRLGTAATAMNTALSVSATVPRSGGRVLLTRAALVSSRTRPNPTSCGSPPWR